MKYIHNTDMATDKSSVFDWQNWNNLFWMYENDVLNYASDDWIIINLPSISSPSSHFLDAGCGDGRHLLQAAQLGWDVIGVDISEKALSMAKKRLEKEVSPLSYELIKADLHKPFLSNRFCSAGICTDVLSVVHSPTQVLRILHNSVQKGAIFLVTLQSIEDGTCGDGILEDECFGRWRTYIQNEMRYTYYTDDGVYELIRSTDWRILDIEKFQRLDPPHAHRPYEHYHCLYGCMLQAK